MALLTSLPIAYCASSDSIAASKVEEGTTDRSTSAAMQKSLCPSRRSPDPFLSFNNQPAAEQQGEGDDRACETPRRRVLRMPACDDPRASVRAMAGGAQAPWQAAVPVANGAEEQPRSATSSALQRPAEGAAVTAAKPRSLFRPRPGVDGVSFTVHPWGRRDRRIGNER